MHTAEDEMGSGESRVTRTGPTWSQPASNRVSPGDKRRRFERTALVFSGSLYRTARRLTRCQEDAEDLVQETFLRAYRTFDNFTPGTNCKAWLFTILHSIWVNRYRREAREPDRAPLDEHFHRLAANAAFDAQVAIVESAEWAGPEVARALDALPSVFRLAVLLVDVEGLSYQEAADALDCPIGTVRSRVYRARRILFTALVDLARERRLLEGEVGGETSDRRP